MDRSREVVPTDGAIVDPKGFGRRRALSILERLPVIDQKERGGVVLETRLIGTFAPKVAERDMEALGEVVETQGFLQDALTDYNNNPSTTFDPAKGQVTFTHRASLLSYKTLPR